MKRNIFAIKKLPIAALVFCVAVLTVGCSDDVKTSQAHLAQAKKHVEQGEISSAMIELKNVLKLESNNQVARKLLGNAYFQQGYYVEAEKELSRAYRLNRADTGAFFLYAKVLLRLDSFDELEPLLAINKNWTADKKSQLLSLKLLMYIMQSKELEARELVASSEFNALSHVELTYAKAQFYWRDNDIEASQSQLTKLLTEMPLHIDGLLLQGELYYLTESFSDSLDFYQKASSIRTIDPQIKVKIAQALIGLKRYDEAENILAKVLTRFPLFHQANYYFSYIKLINKDFDTALIHAEKVLELIPYHHESQYVAAQASFALKMHVNSHRWSSKLITAYPSNASILKLHAANQLMLNQHNSAINTLSKIAEQDLYGKDAALFVEAAKGRTDAILTREALLLRASQLTPQDNHSKWRLANINFAKGNYEQGSEYLLAALKNSPQSYAIKSALASSYLKTDQLKKAQVLVDELKAAGKKKPDAYTLQAMIYIKRNEGDLAMENLRQALAYKPGDANANHNLAQFAILDRNYELAKDHYKRILKANPNNLLALKQMWLLEKRIGNDKLALSWLKQAVTQNPTHVSLNIALAQTYISLNNYREVIAQLGDRAQDFSDVLMVRLLLGQAYYLDHQYQPAALQFSQAVKMAPNNAIVHYWQALNFEKSKALSKALASVSKASLLLPHDRIISTTVARLLLANNDLKNAGPLINRLIKKHPNDVKIRENQARFTFQNKEYSKAVSLYTSLFEDYESNLILVQLSTALTVDNQHQLAIEKLNQWLTKYPKDILVLNILANEYLRLDQPSNASDLFTRIVEITPANSMAQNNLAWLLFKNGETSLAQTHAELAHEAAPQSAVFNDTLGQILLAHGDYAQSRTMLKIANKKMPNNLQTKYSLAQATAKSGDKPSARVLLQQILSVNNDQSAATLVLRQNTQRLLLELE